MYYWDMLRCKKRENRLSFPTSIPANSIWLGQEWLLATLKLHTESYGFIQKGQWIRAYGGALPCCNNSEKGSLEFWKNKGEKRKMCEKGKILHEK